MYRSRSFWLLVAAALAASLGGLSIYAASPDQPRGVENFHAVDEHIFRGGQPSGQGFQSLARMGIKTVIDLRGGRYHERYEGNLVLGAGMHYVPIPLSGLLHPRDVQIAGLLALLEDSSQWPVFIHCKRGADRTGTVVACYRIAHDHWSNQKALAEAKTYGLSSLELAMQRYILHFEPAGAR